MKKLIVKVVPKEKPVSKSQLLLEGKQFYNFCLPIDLMSEWISKSDIKPNERILELIKNDLNNKE
jgi:hypothetical protein